MIKIEPGSLVCYNIGNSSNSYGIIIKELPSLPTANPGVSIRMWQVMTPVGILSLPRANIEPVSDITNPEDVQINGYFIGPASQ